MRSEPVLAALTRYQGELERLNNRRDYLAQAYVEHCLSHGICPSLDRPAPIQAYATLERQLRLGVWAGAILGAAVFGLLSAFSLQGAAPQVIFLASAAFAVLVGALVTCLTARAARVETKDPNSGVRADRVLLSGGAVAVLALSAFMYMRFAEDANVQSFFPAAAMAFETGVTVFTAAAAVLIPLYSWPGELARSYDVTLHDIEMVQLKIDVSRKQVSKEKSTYEESNPSSSAHRLDSLDSVVRANGSAPDHQRGL
jgi:hypothetical protein